jgi:streptogramin lyase
VVQLRSEAKLDHKALEKAMFVEYIYREDPKKYPIWPWGHNLAFDGDGNVWLAYTACCIVRFDPRTGESKAFEGNGSGSGIVVDHTDGTVWYSGDITAENGGGTAPGNQSRAIVKRLDPKTGLVDKWLGGGSIAQVFDSKGNLWMTTGNLTKWDRKTDSLVRWGVPVIRSSPYGMTIDSKDKIWFPEHYMGGITRFDPETETFKFFPLTKELPANIRRPGVDSKDMIWAATWASPNREVNGRNIGGTLYRLNPETGEVMGRSLGIEYSNPYDADADLDDNIWVASDNYISMYDQKADAFTHYPIPTRSDTLKTNITRDGAIWFVNRNAGKFAGKGGAVVALYPDKDKINTLAAYYPEKSPHYRYSQYRGPKPPKVTGTLKFAVPLRNADEYEKWAIANGLPGPDAARPVKQENEERY